MSEGVGRSVRTERTIKSRKDGLKWSWWQIEEGGWWRPCVPLDDAWAANVQQGQNFNEPLLIVYPKVLQWGMSPLS